MRIKKLAHYLRTREKSAKLIILSFNPPSGYAAIFDESGSRIERLPDQDPMAIAENQRRLLLS
jgi:hypothetical protein